MLIVSVDGGCDGVQQVKDGIIGTTSQHYHSRWPRNKGQGDRRDRPAAATSRRLRGSRLLQHRRRARPTRPPTASRPIDTTEGADSLQG
ncbi:MAG: hypothetical protein R2734_15570 [Nocardioides sp.]